MILLFDNYDSFTYNLYHSINKYNDNVFVVRNDQLTLNELDRLVNKKSLSSIVLSPGPGRPESAGLLLKVIEKYLGKIPILGVCLGHQAIGMVLGAKIIKAPKILHGKPSMIFHNGKGLYQGLDKPFVAARYHSLCIDPSTIKKEYVDAYTEDQTIMGISNEYLLCYGVQYHPESVLTTEGDLLIKNFCLLKKQKKVMS